MRAGWALGLAFACLVAAGCTSDSEPAAPRSNEDPPTRPPADAPTDFPAPTAEQLADGVRLGDQTDQALSAVAAAGESLVAVGYDASAGTTSPLFLTSADAGETWERGLLANPETATGPESPVSVAAGPDRLVAIGSSAGRPVSWTSADGTEWTRTTLDRNTFRDTDTVSGVRYEAGRFWLIGSSDQPRAFANQRVLLWTSRDGLEWDRRDLSRRGVTVVGTPSVVDLVADGDELVLAGTIANLGDSAQDQQLAIWRSSNRGQKFRADPTPPDLGGTPSVIPRDLFLDDGNLYLAVSGDGADTGLADSWDGVVLIDRGQTWEPAAPPSFGRRVDEHPAVLIRVADIWVLAGSATTEQDAVVATGPAIANLTGQTDATLAGPDAQAITGGVSTGDSGILVGSTRATGSTEPAVWRVDEGGVVAQVELAPDLTAGPPTTQVSAVVATASGFAAVGTVAQSPVAWDSADAGSWTPTGLSGRVPAIASVSVADAAVAGETLFVAGTLRRGLGDDLAVWQQSAGEWAQLEAAAFDAGFSTLSAAAIAVRDDRVVLAGNADPDGAGTRPHPLAGSTDGTGWRTGKGIRRRPSGGSATMADVVDTRRGFLVGGGRSRPGEGEEPVVWSAGKRGASWEGPLALPRAEGAYANGITGLARSARTVVATGYTRNNARSPNPGWLAWVSEDGGRTWRKPRVVEDRRATVNTVHTVPGGYVALGSTGRADDQEGAAWYSDNGRRWESLDLPAERTSGPGAQFLHDAVVEDGVLRVIGADVPPGGGGYYVAEVPLPVP